MQQALGSSSWHSRAWHHPLSSAFFCSPHNLWKPADCRWRALLRLSWSRQLSAGRHSTFNAHSSCLLFPDAVYTWHLPPHTPVRSPRGYEVILTPPSPKPPYRLLIRPSSTLTKQIIGLQGKTGVTTDSCQKKDAQLCILVPITPLHIWIIFWMNSSITARHSTGEG